MINEFYDTIKTICYGSFMGQSKGGGYSQKDALLPEQQGLLQQLIAQAGSGGNMEAAMEGFKQFLPGGGGGQAIKDQAMQDYQKQTVPSILGAFGANSKGGTGLNQALSSSGSDLNTGLSSQLAQMQMQAAGGLGGLAQGQMGQALGTQGFAYMPNQTPLWAQLLQTGIGAAGNFAGGKWAPWNKK
jgi:hypothetical protein